MTLADMQTHLHAFINSSTMTVRSNRIRKPRPLKPGLVWLTRKWLGQPMQDRAPGGYNFEEDARAYVDLLKAKIKNRPEFEAYYDPGAHHAFASSRPLAGQMAYARRSATLATPSPCTERRTPTNSGDRWDWRILLGVHSPSLNPPAGPPVLYRNQTITGITPHGHPRCHRKYRKPKPDWRSADEDRNYETPSPLPGGNGNTLFATVTNLNAHLTAITVLLLFS
ncbi:hypothetical protein EDB92DRAFT_1957581 [Lactarius akahatsu]|uniref:Uncharacterized protein n=1 Tax=Lactarius akahatsu TaxID=416441 RepID=A0AAD4L7E3_9AGAM|nr:hypothetical protein EDB92DRAFT_1957581 [Lactarius akahatsu]